MRMGEHHRTVEAAAYAAMFTKKQRRGGWTRREGSIEGTSATHISSIRQADARPLTEQWVREG